MIRELVLSDIDGTVFENPPIFITLAKQQHESGVLGEGVWNGINHTRSLRNAGAIDYEDYAQRLLDLYAQGLKGARLVEVLTQTRSIIASGAVRLHTNVATMLQAVCCLHDLSFVTASPQFVGQAVSELFPGSGYISTVFAVEDGIFTGGIDLSLARGEAKRNAITETAKRYPKGVSVALGDAIGDAEMLKVARIAICVNPEPELEAVAITKGYRMIPGIVSA